MMMELFLLTLFITVKLSVTQSVITVGRVPVQQGKSIIIPCSYNAKYINYPKYLCFGYLWSLCRVVKQMEHRTVSILDDQNQHIFTVTMENVTTDDAGQYWCSVETPGLDVKKSFQLQVTKTTAELYVDDQNVIGYEGSDVVISCYHQAKKPKAWCKIGGTCIYTTGYINGAFVRLRDIDRGFRVTMSELMMDNQGWYYCSAGDEHMPVYITVQSYPPNWERSSFAWLVFLGLLIVLACMAVTVLRQHKQRCEMFSWHKKSENTYVSMKKPKLQEHEDQNVEAQDYEIMSSPAQKLEVQGKESPKADGDHITYKGDFVLKGPHCTC